VGMPDYLGSISCPVSRTGETDSSSALAERLLSSPIPSSSWLKGTEREARLIPSDELSEVAPDSKLDLAQRDFGNFCRFQLSAG